MSEWWEWPTLNSRQIPFWISESQKIISIGNPAVWWGVFATVALSLIAGSLHFLAVSEHETTVSMLSLSPVFAVLGLFVVADFFFC